MPAVLVGTEPFADLARLEASLAGIPGADLRLLLFGPVLGDVPAPRVVARAEELAADLLALLPPPVL